MWLPIQKARKKYATKDAKKISNLSERKAGPVSANLFHGIQTFKKRISDQELESAWETGNWAKLMKIIPWDDLPQDIAPALAGVGAATLAAGKLSIEALPSNVNARLRWDMSNPILRRYVVDRTSKLVVGVNLETQEIIQNAVARSFNRALTPREMAKQIKGSIGLHPRQALALQNYEERLIADGLRGGRLEDMVGRYEDQLLSSRAKAIARTEMRGASNTGQLSVWKEAANQDLIDRRTARRAWIAEGDTPCDDCKEMDGEEVGLDEMFTMPDGTQVETPPWGVHPNCYCGSQLVI